MLFLLNAILEWLNRPTDWRADLERLRAEENERRKRGE
jgi:hypothetical protein